MSIFKAVPATIIAAAGANLDANRYDVVINQVGITDKRKEKFAFSDPYIASRAVLIVKDDNADIRAGAGGAGARGHPMVIATHDLRLAAGIAHEVIFLEAGEGVEKGEAKQVFANPQRVRTRRVIATLTEAARAHRTEKGAG